MIPKALNRQTRLLALVIVLTQSAVPIMGEDRPMETKSIDWQQLPRLVAPHGLGGALAGISGETLVVAGGTNLPEGRPWNGFVKQWHDKIYLLKKSSSSWQMSDSALPRPVGYPVAVSTRFGIAVIGGSNGKQHFSDAYLLRVESAYSSDTQILIESLPPLPMPLAYSCGAAIGDMVYVAGGQSLPDDSHTQLAFFAIDLGLESSDRCWKKIDPWPGPARMLAVAAASKDSFYLMSGVDLYQHLETGVPTRRYLTDAYYYKPTSGWSRIAELPHAVAAAPSPSLLHDTDVFVFGGDDGQYVDRIAELKDNHPGFNRDILVYSGVHNKWRVQGQLLFSQVTTSTILTDSAVIIPGGEPRPGVRAPNVWQGKLEN